MDSAQLKARPDGRPAPAHKKMCRGNRLRGAGARGRGAAGGPRDGRRFCRRVGGGDLVKSCPVKAISIDPLNHQKAIIDGSKCISCGQCVYQCPFGAISDKSFITDAIRILRESEKNTAYKVYAVVAPMSRLCVEFEEETRWQAAVPTWPGPVRWKENDISNFDSGFDLTGFD